MERPSSRFQAILPQGRRKPKTKDITGKPGSIAARKVLFPVPSKTFAFI